MTKKEPLYRCWSESVLQDCDGIIYCTTDDNLRITCASIGLVKCTDLTRDQICGNSIRSWVEETDFDCPVDQKVQTWSIPRGIHNIHVDVFCQRIDEGWSFLGASLPLLDSYVFEKMTRMENELINLNREHQRTIYELKILQEKLRELATHDELTGTLRRLFFLEQAEQLRKEALRYERSFSLLLFDLDHFKSVNDTFGHSAGDEVLRQVAERVRICLRVSDLFSRYGGEEFCILMPQTVGSQASILAERIRKAVTEQPVNIKAEKAINVTISIGVAELSGDESISSLIQRADESMYRAKHSGRNCVVLSP